MSPVFKDYLELTKPRIAAMVGVTAFLGFWLAGGRDAALLGWTLAGTVLCSAASGALNQFLERDPDGLMLRTRNRPLPAGRLQPSEALVFGLACGGWGLALLAWKANPLAAALAGLTITLYAAFYTPLKRVTPMSTWIGAASGAIPPMIGWAAAAGSLGLGAWLLFAIQFFWQMPHFLALFWIYREDYKRAGFRFLPVIDEGAGATGIQIALHSLALLLATMLPALLGYRGMTYAWGALAAGTAFLALGMRASWTMETADMRRLFRASLVYLPGVLGLLAGVR